MEWPWVSRRYLELNKAFDKQIQEALGARLALAEKELDFYRAKFEAEKERADRAVDALVMAMGREPISEATGKLREPYSAVIKEMQEQTKEIFADVSDSILQDAEISETSQEEGPLDSPLADIQARLEKLKLLPRYQPKKDESSATPQSSDTIS